MTIEHKVLTNDERRHFGLEIIKPEWGRLQIKEGACSIF